MVAAISGVSVLVLAGVMNAAFTLPMKYTRRWEWENTWLAWSLFALVMLPVAITAVSVPHLERSYQTSGSYTLNRVMAFGAGWGVAQVLFGLAVNAIGIALTFSLVLGTSAAVGTLIPLIRLHSERLHTHAGHAVIAGVVVVLAGVSVCAAAGRQRERAEAPQGGSKTSLLGLSLALLCGLGASFVNLGMAFGAPLAEVARSLGAGPLTATNAVWMPLMLAGAIPNVLYCLWRIRKKRSADRFSRRDAGHWGLALVMAIFWFGSTVLYGVATVRLGPLGAVLGWPLYMSLIVITASLLGMLTGEWKHSGKMPLQIQWSGVLLLVIAVFILASSGAIS